MSRQSGVTMVRAIIAVGLMLCLSFAGTVTAATPSESTPSSQNYKITEPQFGTGSSIHDCSASYCANTSTGDTAIGRMMGKDYRAQAGGATSDEPLLEVAASGGIANLGTLDPSRTATLTMTVGVRSYLTGGYVLQITGDPPGYGLHEISRLDKPTASRAGSEQFGINLVHNKTPALGEDPVQVPSSQTSFGRAANDYGKPDLFMYKDGDIVAQSDTDSGRTDYTISMILNISNTTPKGWYVSVFSAVVVPVY